MTTLPPDAQRYLVRMRSLRPPVDLVDSVMAEVEATPQVRAWPRVGLLAAFAAGAAAALLAFAVLPRLALPTIGPAATPVALDQLPSAGRIATRVPVDPDDVPAVYGHGFLWLANAVTGELVRLDPTNGSIATPRAVTSAGSQLPVAVTERSLWVADARDGTLVELEPVSMQERRRIPATAHITSIAAEGDIVWALDDVAGVVLRLDLAAGEVALSVPVEGATALLVDHGVAWVADTSGSVARIDPGRGGRTDQVDVGVPATQLVATGDSILIVGQGSDPLLVVDPGSMRVTARGATAVRSVASDGRLWALLPSGHVVRLDPVTLQPVAALSLELARSRGLVSGGGVVWTSGRDPLGDTYLVEMQPEP